jgi:hypothetical protein
VLADNLHRREPRRHDPWPVHTDDIAVLAVGEEEVEIRRPAEIGRVVNARKPVVVTQSSEQTRRSLRA